MTSGGAIDTLSAYTAERLCAWGREVRGGGEYLGLPRVNLLHRDHTGGIACNTRLSDEAWITERIVTEIHAESSDCATVLRAVYCGRGRWAEERRKRTEAMLGRRLSRRRFWALHDDAFARVRWFFEQMARMAA